MRVQHPSLTLLTRYRTKFRGFLGEAYRGFIALHLGGQRHRGLFLTIPARRWAVIGCTSLPVRAHSWPIGSFDTLSPMQDRHQTPTGSGG
jgi:hypothetical protein